eukprot:4837779-Prorocentrum_lima.AAC.1
MEGTGEIFIRREGNHIILQREDARPVTAIGKRTKVSCQNIEYFIHGGRVDDKAVKLMCAISCCRMFYHAKSLV